MGGLYVGGLLWGMGGGGGGKRYVGRWPPCQIIGGLPPAPSLSLSLSSYGFVNSVFSCILCCREYHSKILNACDRSEKCIPLLNVHE